MAITGKNQKWKFTMVEQNQFNIMCRVYKWNANVHKWNALTVLRCPTGGTLHDATIWSCNWTPCSLLLLYCPGMNHLGTLTICWHLSQLTKVSVSLYLYISGHANFLQQFLEETKELFLFGFPLTHIWNSGANHFCPSSSTFTCALNHRVFLRSQHRHSTFSKLNWCKNCSAELLLQFSKGHPLFD